MQLLPHLPDRIGRFYPIVNRRLAEIPLGLCSETQGFVAGCDRLHKLPLTGVQSYPWD